MEVQEELDNFRSDTNQTAEKLKEVARWFRSYIAQCYGKPITAKTHRAIIRQKNELATLIDTLTDFLEYMKTDEAWCKIEPPKDYDFISDMKDTMSELLKKL